MALANLPAPCEAAAAQVAPETPGCASHAKSWVLLATVAASSLVFLQATVINVALPAIQGALGVSVTTMQWIASMYTLALAALTMVGGALGDRFGRRHLLLIGLALVILASVGAGLAPSPAALIVARALQGLGAALVAPNSLAHLSASFPRAERGRALGIWSAASALTGGAAPLIGGWLVDAASWRAVFLVGVPPALVVWLIVLTRVPESRAPHSAAALDVPGATFATLAFATLTAGLITFTGSGAPATATALLAVGLALLAVFVGFESYSSAPMMPLSLFRVASFSAANLLTALLYFAVSATFFLLPFVLVQAYGYSATLTGAVFLPFALVMGVLSSWSGGLLDHWGAKRPLIFGPSLVAAGLALFGSGIGDGSYWTTFAPPMAFIGLGMAITSAPLTAVVMGTVDMDLAGVASGINNTVARLAALLSVAVAGLLAMAVFSGALRQRVAAIEAPAEVKVAVLEQRRDLGDARVPASAGAAAPMLTAALRSAFVDAFHTVALVSAALALAGAGVAAVAVDARAAGERGAAGVFICEHLAQVAPVSAQSESCAACVRDGLTWIHLRACLTCGHVGCCDASKRQHATRHFRTTGHPIVQSLAPGETWRWCYLDEHVV